MLPPEDLQNISINYYEVLQNGIVFKVSTQALLRSNRCSACLIFDNVMQATIPTNARTGWTKQKVANFNLDTQLKIHNPIIYIRISFQPVYHVKF